MTLLQGKLRELLVCPVDQGELDEIAAKKELVCRRCRHRYQIRNGIPVMLAEPECPTAREPAEAASSLRNRKGCR